MFTVLPRADGGGHGRRVVRGDVRSGDRAEERDLAERDGRGHRRGRARRNERLPAPSAFRRDTNVTLWPVRLPEPVVNAPTCARERRGRRRSCPLRTAGEAEAARVREPPVRAIAVNVASELPVATLAPAPTNAFEPTESVIVATARVPSTRSWTLRNSASANGRRDRVGGRGDPAGGRVTDVGEPLPASVPTKAATSVVSVACRFARPTPTPNAELLEVVRRRRRESSRSPRGEGAGGHRRAVADRGTDVAGGTGVEVEDGDGDEEADVDVLRLREREAVGAAAVKVAAPLVER